MVEAEKKPSLRFTKTFKKYTDEFDSRVVEYVRGWARTEPVSAFHEDASIVKVTATQPMIDSLLAALKDKFQYVPPEMREGAKKSDEEEG